MDLRNESNLYLFIIWSNALPQFEEILNDLASRFTVIKVIDVKWDADNFSRNMARFYGQKLPSLSRKENESGVKPFKAVVIKDSFSDFDYRVTSQGNELVNVNVFDAKSRYRKITGGGHKIHCTNNERESMHDLLLLTKIPYCHWCENSLSKPSHVFNLIGCIQWNSFAELFDVMNEILDYVVLRNMELIHDDLQDNNHEDIDILVRCKDEAALILNATKIHFWWFRSHYTVNVNNRSVRFDIRFIGDGYYDLNWEEDILSSREKFNGFYIPSKEHLTYSLLYHALIHKRKLSSEYVSKLGLSASSDSELFANLVEFMHKNNYKFTEPKDLSVYYNPQHLKSSCSKTRFIYNVLRIFNNLVKNVKNKITSYAKNKVRQILS
jgi:hypothetical protein